MKFTTPVDIPVSKFPFNYQSKILSLGSCFAENIGMKMKELYFDMLINPMGVVFNPLSIAAGIKRLLHENPFTSDELLHHNGLWFNFSFSTLFSGTDPDVVLAKMNESYQQGRSQLLNADRIIITPGTAWVYGEADTGMIVANCHKLPAQRFIRRRLSVDEIVGVYKSLIPEILAINPGLRIIFTVSPVRHIKDGLHENNISKSVLHLFVEELTSLFDRTEYFPAWEIMMDELRDYRFYASDMLHPSDQAVDYIFDKFCACCIDPESLNIVSEVKAYKHNLNHRLIHPESRESRLFLENTQKQQQLLLRKYPFLSERML